MTSKSIIRAYCDCGHLSIYHLMWKMKDDSKYVKCFGADRDTYYRTLSKYDLDDNVATELMNENVACLCKRLSLIKFRNRD
jgi:hypothetical protein